MEERGLSAGTVGWFGGSRLKVWMEAKVAGVSMNGQVRSNIRPGLTVLIVLKQDQRTGRLTRGIVKDILTKSPTHPHGIKVRLQDGQVGRVKEVVG